MLQKGVFTIDEAAGEFRADFLDQVKVRDWILRKLNPAGPRCAYCGEGILPGKAAVSFWNGGRVCCKSCGRYFTASTGTMISGAALDERDIFTCALLLGFEVPVAEIAEILARSEETVRAWRSKLALASEPISPWSTDLSTPPPGERGGAAQGAGVDLPFERAADLPTRGVSILQPVAVWARGNRLPVEPIDGRVFAERLNGVPFVIDPDKEKAAELVAVRLGVLDAE